MQAMQKSLDELRAQVEAYNNCTKRIEQLTKERSRIDQRIVDKICELTSIVFTYDKYK